MKENAARDETRGRDEREPGCSSRSRSQRGRSDERSALEPLRAAGLLIEKRSTHSRQAVQECGMKATTATAKQVPRHDDRQTAIILSLSHSHASTAVVISRWSQCVSVDRRFCLFAFHLQMIAVFSGSECANIFSLSGGWCRC